jgi:hypothetical protein
MTYNKLNDLIHTQSQPEYLSDCDQFKSDNPHIDFTQYSDDSYIIFSYITDQWSELRSILYMNHIPFTELLDEFDESFIIVE